jgi:putative ABC transport system permease protein
MIVAIWRKLRADIKTNKLQFTLILGVLTLSAMLLMISLLVMGSAEEPWDRTFEATNGPHLWIVSHHYDLDYSPILTNSKIIEYSKVILALAENPLVLGDEKRSIYIYAMDEQPRVAHPLVAEGRWLDPKNLDEVVLDFSLARYFNFQVGDRVTILGAQGTRDLSVVGLAVTAHWFPYNDITVDLAPGIVYVSEETLKTIQPDPASWYSVIGLRLVDPESSIEFGNEVYEAFPGKLRSILDWHFTRENATLSNTLSAMFMGLFSILGLAAVGMIIFNTIGGQVLSQYREIGLLKAIGFVPRQVTIMFLGEHLFIGMVAAILGIGAGLMIAPELISTLAENLNTTPPDIYTPGPLILVLLLVEGAVTLATILPAWQGGRINTIQAITIGYRNRHHRASRLAGVTAKLRFPTVVVLGIKDIFSKPLRATLAIASLFLTVLVAITAVGAQATTRDLSVNRVYFNSTSADMKVERNFVPQQAIQEKILSNSNITDHYEEVMVWGQAPGHSEQPLAIRLLDGDYQDFDFQIKEGRMIAAPGEAVMGYAVLNLIDAQVGDRVEIQMEGTPVKLTIVGRHVESYNTNNVVITDLETYRKQVDPNLQPTTYYLRLKNYEAAEGLRQEWLTQSQGLINVRVITEKPQAAVEQVRILIVSLGTILMIVAGANLMSTSLLSIRERVRDFGIQKTLGLTPTQIANSVVIGAISIVLIAFALGISGGVWLMNRFIQQVGIELGSGPDFFNIPWSGLVLLLPILVLVAIISSLLPALRAARLEVIEALRYE